MARLKKEEKMKMRVAIMRDVAHLSVVPTACIEATKHPEHMEQKTASKNKRSAARRSLQGCPFCGVRGKKCDIGYSFEHDEACWFWRHLSDGLHWLHPNDFAKWNKRAAK